MDAKRELLRHTVATVAYRGGKAVRGAPPSFAAYSSDGSPRTPAKILAHIGDLFDWALSQAKGAEAWTDSTPLDWERDHPPPPEPRLRRTPGLGLRRRLSRRSATSYKPVQLFGEAPSTPISASTRSTVSPTSSSTLCGRW